MVTTRRLHRLHRLRRKNRPLPHLRMIPGKTKMMKQLTKQRW
jgi:hypothetical protein